VPKEAELNIITHVLRDTQKPVPGCEAPGGRIFRYSFDERSYDFLGIPVPNDYIQTIALDEEEGLIYGITYPVFNFFAYDIRKKTNRYHQYVGSASHMMALDDDGCVWKKTKYISTITAFPVLNPHPVLCIPGPDLWI